MKPIYSQKAPQPVGPYSQALMVDRFLFVSGQIGIDPASGKLREGFERQVRQIFENLQAILESAGADRRHIVRMVVYLKDMSLFGEFNRLYEEFFRDVPVKPVRTTVAVSALPLDALVEVEATAYVEK